MRSLNVFVAAFFAISCFVSSAYAQDCVPLKRAISVDLQSGPAGLRMMVPVTINGTTKLFLLDTGGGQTSLSRKTATEMGLAIHTSNTLLYDMYGNGGSGEYASVDIGIGPVVAKQYGTLILPNPNATVDGELAPDLMARYDIEMDFGRRKLNYFLPDHCDGHVIYWPASSVGVVSYRGWDDRNTHMTVPVTLDGHNIMAMVDTGSTRTTLNNDIAHELFDLSPDSAGAVPMGTMDGDPSHKMFGWAFKKLEIGVDSATDSHIVTVTNPHITIIPNLVGKNTQATLEAGSQLERRTDRIVPMLLGMDVLSKLHLYIAAKEKKLYVTSAELVPVPPAEASPAGAH